jgi:hypothetical protein
VETSLPKKTETLVFCEMSPLQRETYKKILERDLSVIAGTESTGRTAILNIVMQLRKARFVVVVCMYMYVCMYVCMYVYTHTPRTLPRHLKHHHPHAHAHA